jgi:hypothetical protein
METIRIPYSGNIIGEIDFDPATIFYIANRNQFFIDFTLRGNISLHKRDERIYAFSNVTGTVIGKRDSGDECFYLGGFDSPEDFFTPLNKSLTNFLWRVSVPELISFENFRNGLAPIFRINLSGFTSRYTKVDDFKYYQSLPERLFESTFVKIPLDPSSTL